AISSSSSDSGCCASKLRFKRLRAVYHAQTRRIFRFNFYEANTASRNRSQLFDRGVRRRLWKRRNERNNCSPSMRRYSVSTWRVRPFLTGIGVQQDRLPRRFSLLDLALLGIATHKLSRIVAKDRITGILRAPFVSYVRSSGAGEVEEEPR